MLLNHLSRVGGERHVGREQLRILERLLPPSMRSAARATGAGASAGAALRDDGLERVRQPREPSLSDGVPKRRLAREMSVHRAVANPERLGDVDHGGLGRPVPAQDLLRSLEIRSGVRTPSLTRWPPCRAKDDDGAEPLQTDRGRQRDFYGR